MNHALNTLCRRGRPLILGLVAVTVFLMAFGICSDVMPVKPRLVITAPESCALVGFDATGNALLTRRFTLDEHGKYLQAWDVATGTAIPLPELNVAELKDVSRRYPGYPNAAKEGLIQFGAPVGPALRAVLGELDSHWSMAFSPDRTFVSFPEQKMGEEPWRVAIWDVKADRKIASHVNPGTWPRALAPGGRQIAYFVHDPQAKTPGYTTLMLSDLQTQRELLRDAGRGGMDTVQFSPDGAHIALIHSTTATSSVIKLWSTETGEEVLTAKDSGSFVFTESDRFLVTRPTRDQSQFHLDVWDCQSGRHAARLYRRMIHGRTFVAVPKSNLLLLSAYDVRDQNHAPFSFRELEATPRPPPLHIMRFLDVETGRTVGSIREADAWGFTAICPLGKTLATLPSSGAGKEIHLYDVPPRRALGLYVLIASLAALVSTVLVWLCTLRWTGTKRAAGYGPAGHPPG